VYATALVALAVIATAALVAPMIFMRTPYATDQGRPIIQPVAFDHRHHVRDDGIDCLYCHPDAERAPSAGLPSTELCMGCHGQVWPDSPLLAQVRASWETGKAIPWRRVNAVPGFVYFNHGVHVRGAGVECARCHGKVQDMARVSRHAPLTMEWCLGCHRNPPNQPDQGRRITPLTTCSACHR
jgi:hypothetical protein